MKRLYFGGALAAIGIIIGLWLTDRLPFTAPVLSVDTDCTGNVAMKVRYGKAFGSRDFTDIGDASSHEHGVDSISWAKTVTTDSQTGPALGEVNARMRYRPEGGDWSPTIRMVLSGRDVQTILKVDPGATYEYEIVLNEEGRPVVLTDGTFGIDTCPAEYDQTQVRLESDSGWYENQPQ